MIYTVPPADAAIDQGDLIDNCPVAVVVGYSLAHSDAPQVQIAHHRGIVLTQTCDLANKKADTAVIGRAFDAQYLVDNQVLKTADVKGVIRATRVWGYYFLPAAVDLGLPEMIVDLRHLHTLRVDLLLDLCKAGKRRARVQPL